MRSTTWIGLAAALVSSAACAGGVGLSATRMIYAADASQATLGIRNTHPEASFLIQSWTENEKGQRTGDFVITPPLYVTKPASESVIKIMFNGKALPQDRETLYWLTVKAIPQQLKKATGNSLQFASANRIKIFYRPEGLQKNANEAFKKLTGNYAAGKVTLNNPTPYYITTINLKVDGRAVQSVMIPPRASTTLAETFNHATSISYQTINDYGAWTPATHISTGSR